MAIPPAGDYLLVVSRVNNDSLDKRTADTDRYALTFGAVGPQGLQGIQGPQGPAGPTGATGPQGPAGVDTLGSLSCAAGQTAKFNGTAWVCDPPRFGPNFVNNQCWSSTTNGNDETFAWDLLFLTGIVSQGDKGDRNFVRAVRRDR